ncbi:hypothetical protein ABTE40_21215, partial [Acinetobacter baumannii]
DKNRLQLLDTSVTINAGLSGVAFKYKVNDNNIFNVDSTVIITAAGNGAYPSANESIQIIDDELATLSISFSKDSIKVGDTLQLT